MQRPPEATDAEPSGQQNDLSQMNARIEDPAQMDGAAVDDVIPPVYPSESASAKPQIHDLDHSQASGRSPMLPMQTSPPYGVYPGPTASYAPHPTTLVPPQPGFYQFDPNYVHAVPFAYYGAAPMQPAYDYQQPSSQLWAAAMSGAQFPYRPAYVPQPTQDPYQIYDEEGNAMATYMPPAPQQGQLQPTFVPPSPAYAQSYYPSGVVTPTPYNLSRTATTATSSSSGGNGSGGNGGGRLSRAFSTFSSSDSLQSSDPAFSSSNGRSSSYHRGSSSQNGHFSPPNTTLPAPVLRQPAAYEPQQPSKQQHYHQQQQTPTPRAPRPKHAATDTLPKPPVHGDFALWVGNIPSDATHAELWTFFTNRPAPPPTPEESSQSEDDDDDDANGTGVKSIHLIVRTNCCFVNFVSQRHLDFALSVNHGVALRPQDPRAKELVCRIRKKEDSTRSGVGAQRSMGIHKSWVWDKEQQRQARERVEQSRINTIEYAANNAASEAVEEDQIKSPGSAAGTGVRPTQKSSSTDHSTNSTTSSFLARYFAKRYFILKAHDENDLHESVKSGQWSTQNHNQSVLDRAYSTAREGVFLFFSANRSGEFFGVARMDGPIAKPIHQSSLHPDSAAPAGFHQFAAETTLSPQQLVSSSPAPVDPQRAERYLQAVKETLRQQRHNHSEPLPVPVEEEETIAERRGASLDTGRLADGIRDLSMQETSPSTLVEVALEAGSGPMSGVTSAPGSADSFHRDVIQSPEERNARLEAMPQSDVHGPKPSAQTMNATRSDPFNLEWVSTERVPFSRTRNLRNAFNRMKDVKISRDGTELDPVTGEALLSLFVNKSSSQAQESSADLSQQSFEEEQ